MDIRKAFPNRVASDMRYSLQDILEAEKIEVPFPQMDLHLKKDDMGFLE